jgi:hypothetical protein
MTSARVRRPLPALIALFALLLLAALVWWRVLHRSSPHHGVAQPTCSTRPPAPTSSAHALPAPAHITITVLNGTYKLKQHRTGIAGKVQAMLIKDGFHVPAQAGNDTKHKVRIVAEISYGPTGKAGATLLNYYFDQAAKLVPTKSKTATLTLSLGSKYHGLASKAQVAKALAADNLTQSTSPPARSPSRTATCASSSA